MKNKSFPEKLATILESMLNTSVISLNNNFDLMFNGSEDMATESVKIGHFASSRENPIISA